MKPQDEQNISKLSDEQLSKIHKHYYKGCDKIFHQPGVWTAKGDALYDFTCDSSHRCPSCQKLFWSYQNETCNRKEHRQNMEKKKKTQIQLELYRQKYFTGRPGCNCTKDSMCNQCHKILQDDVSKYEHGCGKTWIEQFGGMAAGPGYVKCFNNDFLCDDCAEPLAFIRKLNSQYPYVKIQHLPDTEKMFWSPRNYPYYSGFLQ